MMMTKLPETSKSWILSSILGLEEQGEGRVDRIGQKQKRAMPDRSYSLRKKAALARPCTRREKVRIINTSISL